MELIGRTSLFSRNGWAHHDALDTKSDQVGWSQVSRLRRRGPAVCNIGWHGRTGQGKQTYSVSHLYCLSSDWSWRRVAYQLFGSETLLWANMRPTSHHSPVWWIVSFWIFKGRCSDSGMKSIYCLHIKTHRCCIGKKLFFGLRRT